MSRVVRRRPGVWRDVVDIADYIARDNLGASLRFIDAVERTVTGLAEMPGKGKAREPIDAALHGVRSYAVDGFPNHLVFYTFDDHRVLVIAVLHGARDVGRVLRERTE